MKEMSNSSDACRVKPRPKGEARNVSIIDITPPKANCPVELVIRRGDMYL